MALYFYKGYSRCLSVLQKAQHWKDYFHLFASYVNCIGTTHLFWKRMSGSIWLLPDILKFDLHVKLPRVEGWSLCEISLLYITRGEDQFINKNQFLCDFIFFNSVSKKVYRRVDPPPLSTGLLPWILNLIYMCQKSLFHEIHLAKHIMNYFYSSV